MVDPDTYGALLEDGKVGPKLLKLVRATLKAMPSYTI
jgi:hypothetical protein